MAEAAAKAAEAGAADAGAGDEAPKKKKFGAKKLAIFIGLPLILAGGAYQFGLLDSLMGGAAEGEEGHAAEAEEEEAHAEAIYIDLPDMLVNLISNNKQPSYLKLSVSLEIDDPLVAPEIEKVKPRIVDRFQVYLRELRADDISGSAGVYRLKEELLARINSAIEPHEVKDVLFREMLIQ